MFHSRTDRDPDLLAEWRWLLGGHARLLGWSTSGDLFYVDSHGTVHWLDTGAGETAVVAKSVPEFNDLLCDPERQEELLLLSVVEDFELTHGPLAPSQCLGFTTPPVGGGSYTTENRYALPVAEHAAVTGTIMRQLRDLPDGSRVQFRTGP